MKLGNPNSTVRRPLQVRVAALLATVLALSATLLAAQASADEDLTPITAGAGADWGVKQSFREYVVGPIAHGEIEASAGATVNEDGSFHFPVGEGEYYAPTGSTVLSFQGAVRFSGHEGALDLTIADLRAELGPEDAALYADVTSRPNIEGGELEHYPNLRLAELDPSEAAPSAEGGTTTWPALPASLTAEGAPAFGGFYAAGSALDGFAFGYEGPGGAPLAEAWTEPGSALFETPTIGSIGSGASTVKLAFDPARERIWASSYNFKKLFALAWDDLSPLGEVEVEHNARNVAVDRADGDAFSVDTNVRRVFDAGEGAFALDGAAVGSFGSPASNSLAARQSDGSLFVLQSERLRQFEPDGAGGYTAREYAIPAEYKAVMVGHDDRLYLQSGESTASNVASVELDAGEETAELTQVPGTAGSYDAAVAADGTVVASFFDFSEYPTLDSELRVIHPDGTGGWGEPEVIEDEPGLLFGFPYTEVTPDGSRIFSGDFTSTYKKLIVVEDGEIAGVLGGTATISDIAAAPDGSAYVARNDGSIARIERTGTSPTVLAQPQPAAAEVGAGGSAEVSFSAGAEGDPAPAVQWQVRPLGEARWTDVPGAEADSLTVSVGLADSGSRYRAVYSNPAGSLATEAAAVSVALAAPEPEPEPEADPGDQTTPPAETTPAISLKPRIVAKRGAQRIGRNRTAVLAAIQCRAASPCRLIVPKRVAVRAAGKRFRARVLAPKRIVAGGRGRVRVRLPKAAARELRGHRAKVSLRIRVRAAGKTTARRLVLSLKR